MTTKEKAEKYVDNYNNNKTGYCAEVPFSDITEICEAYLKTFNGNAAKSDYESDCKDLARKVEELAKQIEKLTAENKELNMIKNEQRHYEERMRGKIEAYEFVARCNGVSGAEVMP